MFARIDAGMIPPAAFDTMPTMEFFDRDLPSSELSSRRADYSVHVDRLGLPERLQELAHRELRDSRLRRIVVDHRTRQVILFLRHGLDHSPSSGNGTEGEEGLRDLEILYHRVDLDGLDAELLEERAADPDTEILADEMDRREDGRYVHRLLFHPDGEVELTFQDAAFVERSTNGGGS